MQKIEDLAVDLSSPKNYGQIPTVVGLTFEEGVLLSYLLFLGDCTSTIEALLNKLPMLESTNKIKELRKQLNRKKILNLGPIGGITGRPRGTRDGGLSWIVRHDKLQKLLKDENKDIKRRG